MASNDIVIKIPPNNEEFPGDVIRMERDIFIIALTHLLDRFKENTGLHIVSINLAVHCNDRRGHDEIDKVSLTGVDIERL